MTKPKNQTRKQLLANFDILRGDIEFYHRALEQRIDTIVELRQEADRYRDVIQALEEELALIRRETVLHWHSTGPGAVLPWHGIG